MTIEDALYSYLSTFGGLTAFVKTAIYPLAADQRAQLPYVVYQRISDAPVHALGQTPTLSQSRFQLKSWAGSYAKAKAIKQQLVSALNGFRGVMGGAGGVNVGSCLKVDESEGYEGDPRAYFCRIDFMMFHEDTL